MLHHNIIAIIVSFSILFVIAVAVTRLPKWLRNRPIRNRPLPTQHTPPPQFIPLQPFTMSTGSVLDISKAPEEVDITEGEIGIAA